jgi:hypothetical protein
LSTGVAGVAGVSPHAARVPIAMIAAMLSAINLFFMLLHTSQIVCVSNGPFATRKMDFNIAKFIIQGNFLFIHVSKLIL